MSIALGPRLAIPVGLAMCAISSGLTPIMAYWGWQWVVLLRGINGLGASHLVPINLYIIERWLPQSESANALILMQFFSNAFAIGTPLVSGFLSKIHWKWSFYVPSTLSLIFCVIWYLIVRDEISDNPLMSRKEIDYIEAEKTFNTSAATGKESFRCKWYCMFKMKPFYYFTFVWIIYCDLSGGFLVFLAPNYLHKTLKIAVQENGLYNFVIQAGGIVSMLYPQMIIIFLEKKLGFSLTNARKITLALCKYRLLT